MSDIDAPLSGATRAHCERVALVRYYHIIDSIDSRVCVELLCHVARAIRCDALGERCADLERGRPYAGRSTSSLALRVDVSGALLPEVRASLNYRDVVARDHEITVVVDSQITTEHGALAREPEIVTRRRVERYGEHVTRAERSPVSLVFRVPQSVVVYDLSVSRRVTNARSATLCAVSPARS